MTSVPETPANRISGAKCACGTISVEAIGKDETEFGVIMTSDGVEHTIVACLWTGGETR